MTKRERISRIEDNEVGKRVWAAVDAAAAKCPTKIRDRIEKLVKKYIPR